MSTTWTGSIDTAAAMEKLLAGARAGIADAAADVLSRSNDLAPQESGQLVGSGQVSVDGDDAAITYDTPYAVIQHEKTELRHDDGQAKFLETALLGDTERTAQIITDRVQDELQ